MQPDKRSARAKRAARSNRAPAGASFADGFVQGAKIAARFRPLFQRLSALELAAAITCATTELAARESDPEATP